MNASAKRLMTLSLLFILLTGQALRAQSYVGRFLRADSLPIVFNMEAGRDARGAYWIIRNAGERLKIDRLTRRGDSVVVEMPVFESELRLVTTRKIAEKIKNWQSDESQKTRAGRFPGLPCEGHLVT